MTDYWDYRQQDIDDEYAFRVVAKTGQRYGADGYFVYLHHQCEEWDIAFGSDKEQVVEGLKAFRADVDAAIIRLEQLP